MLDETPEHTLLSLTQSWPLWRRDLLRRAYTQGSLFSADDEAVLALLKRELQIATAPDGLQPEPLDAQHLRGATHTDQAVVLRSVEAVEDVDQLTAGQSLRFASEGVTVVYGQNASGKSGYSRVLKRACGALRRPDDVVRSNVYTTAAGDPRASITCRLGDEEEALLAWTEQGGTLLALQGVSVFDARTADLYLGGPNPLQFEPHDLRVLSLVGAALARIRAVVAAEREPFLTIAGQQQPPMPADTEARSLVARVSISGTELPTEHELRTAGAWDDDHDRRHTALQRQLEGDPRTLAQECSRSVRAVDVILETLRSTQDALGQDRLDRFMELRTTARMSANAATLAAEEQLREEPLPGIGGAAWMRLFEIAREYTAVAYPQTGFPVTGTDRRCVLCQQFLSEEASQRLRRFDEYVRGEAARVADAAASELAAAGEAVREFRPVDGDTLQLRVDQVSEADQDLIAETIGFLRAAVQRRAAWIQILDLELHQRMPALHELPESPVPAWDALREAIDRQRVQHLQAARDPTTWDAGRAELRELEGRNALSGALDATLARREAYERLRELDLCHAHCAPRHVSDVGRQLRRALVTPTWRTKFMELKTEFELNYIPLEVHDQTDEGTSLLGVRLQAEQDVDTTAILSEGESRALALVCFLTDAAMIGEDTTLVLDDPVSSLDHVRRRRVAEYVVTEAANRQIIVFTHDIAFFHFLQVAAGVAVPPVLFSSSRVCRRRDGTGIVSDDDGPREPTSVKRRIRKLQGLLTNAQTTEGGPEEEYERDVTFFYATLRRAWERLVEENLFNGVIQRFSPNVSTMRLRGVHVDDGLWQAVARGMTRVSVYTGHDAPNAVEEEIPATGRLERDLSDLREALAAVTAASSAALGRRTRPDQPPRGDCA